MDDGGETAQRRGGKERRTVGIFFQLTFFLIIIVNASNVVHFIQDIRINIFRLDQSVENSGGMCRPTG